LLCAPDGGWSLLLFPSLWRGVAERATGWSLLSLVFLSYCCCCYTPPCDFTQDKFQRISIFTVIRCSTSLSIIPINLDSRFHGNDSIKTRTPKAPKPTPSGKPDTPPQEGNNDNGKDHNCFKQKLNVFTHPIILRKIFIYADKKFRRFTLRI